MEGGEEEVEAHSTVTQAWEPRITTQSRYGLMQGNTKH